MPDHAAVRIALVAADPHVEVAPILGADARRQVVLAHRGGRVLGPAGTPDGIDRHADHGPRGGHAPRLSGARARAWAKVCTAARPPGGCEPAGRLVHTTVGPGETTARPPRASWAAGDGLGGAEGRPARRQSGEDLVGVEAAVVPHDEARRTRGREIGGHPVATGGRDVLGGAEARRGVGRRHAHARVRAVEAGPRDLGIAAVRDGDARSAPGCGSSRRARGAGRRGSGGPTAARRPR